MRVGFLSLCYASSTRFYALPILASLKFTISLGSLKRRKCAGRQVYVATEAKRVHMIDQLSIPYLV